MHELAAYVLTLHPERPHTVQHHMGRAVQQFFFSLLTHSGPELAAQLHTEGGEVKPYTASGLYDANTNLPVIGTVRPNSLYWIRLTAITENVVRALESILAHCPPQIELNRMLWRVVRIAKTPADHPMAGQHTFGSLVMAHYQGLPPRHIQIQFQSPTAFRSRGVNMPLPIPSLVFGSLADRWNSVAPLPLPDLIKPFIENYLVLARFKGESAAVPLKQGSIQIGFTGEATFSLLPNTPQREGGAEFAPHYEGLSRAVGMLASFGQYCGIGMKTGAGMGMVQGKTVARQANEAHSDGNSV